MHRIARFESPAVLDRRRFPTGDNQPHTTPTKGASSIKLVFSGSGVQNCQNLREQHHTVCNDMISNLIRKCLKSGLVTVTVIVTKSEKLKVGNGNPIINDLGSRYR